MTDADKVFVMLSHGGCIARGEDAAHVFALVHGVDAAAEIQVYAEMTGFPLMELPTEKVKGFPRHNYGDMTSRTKRMVQVFAASKPVDWSSLSSRGRLWLFMTSQMPSPAPWRNMTMGQDRSRVQPRGRKS